MSRRDERDTTIADLHRIRREIAEKFHGDPFAITADAQARAEASGRLIVRRRGRDSGLEAAPGDDQPAPED